MPKHCLVFDLDDTLYLERDYVHSGFAHIGAYSERELGIPNFAERAWRLFSAGHRAKIFDEILQEQNLNWKRSTVEQLVALYRSHSPQIHLLPDAMQCLNALRGRVRLAIISDGPLEAQRNKVAALRLDQWFDSILLTEELGKEKAKPCAASFCLMQERFGFTADRCCYVADNPAKDFIAPRKLGWRTIRVRRRGGLHVAVEANEGWAADLELPDLSRLPTLLEETWLSHWLPSGGSSRRGPSRKEKSRKSHTMH